MKRRLVKIVSFVLFCIIAVSFVNRLADISMSKLTNRYYMLNRELETQTENYDVAVFGSCHAYTSVNPIELEELYGYRAYNMSNPSEIIPISYVRLCNWLKKFTPEVVLVEIWGAFPYNTYISESDIFGSYSTLNLESLPPSLEKHLLTRDYECWNDIDQKFPLAHYRQRIINQELNRSDFEYSLDSSRKVYNEQNPEESDWIYSEMENRFSHRGFKLNPANPVEDYDKMQGDAKGRAVKPDEKILKYLDKIIDVCRKNDVKLIFYRSPYISTDEELMQVNWLSEYFAEEGVPFWNLENEIDFDPETDFNDECHLSAAGASKATSFLGAKIDELIKN